MENNLNANVTIDAKGLACPMPIVKTRQAMNDVESGLVVEVQATDQGSKADLEAWAKSAGHQFLGTVEDGDTFKHYVRKSPDDETYENKHEHVTSNQELEKKLIANENIVVLDVREVAEYAFHHIPNAISIPLGEIEARLSELNKDDEIFVVCNTASRSDLAAQKLTGKGFTNVINVVPGMSQWNGETASIRE